MHGFGAQWLFREQPVGRTAVSFYRTKADAASATALCRVEMPFLFRKPVAGGLCAIHPGLQSEGAYEGRAVLAELLLAVHCKRATWLVLT